MFAMETANIPMPRGNFLVKISYEDSVHHFFNIKGIVHFEFIPQGQPTKLIMGKY
jgi:hypothetical protein